MQQPQAEALVLRQNKVQQPLTGPREPVKPRFLLSPWRTLSPSSSTVMRPRAARACSRVHATVLLPLPLRPARGTQTEGAKSDAMPAGGRAEG